jgi:hypothetical protein
MKKHIAPFAIILAAVLVQAQEPKLDCSKSLDPSTPYGQTLIGCPRAGTPNNIAGGKLSDDLEMPSLGQCRADLASQ